jgi:hypothetical protein
MTHYAPRVIERDPNPKRARMALCVALAGGVAERIIDPTSRGGDEEDRDLAENIAERFLAPETARRELQRAAIRALSLLRKHWQAVEAIADELLANEGELDGAAVRRCIREWAQNGHS